VLLDLSCVVVSQKKRGDAIFVHGLVIVPKLTIDCTLGFLD